MPSDPPPLPEPDGDLLPSVTPSENTDRTAPDLFRGWEKPLPESAASVGTGSDSPGSAQAEPAPFNPSSGLFGSGSSSKPSRLPERQAVHIEEAEPGPSAEVPEPESDDKDEDDQKTAAEPAKPWLPLTLAMAGMFGSLGGMLYCGWIAWDYRIRYRSLLERVIERGSDYESRLKEPGASAERRTESGPDSGY
jgi:hypothetical protein